MGEGEEACEGIQWSRFEKRLSCSKKASGAALDTLVTWQRLILISLEILFSSFYRVAGVSDDAYQGRRRCARSLSSPIQLSFFSLFFPVSLSFTLFLFFQLFDCVDSFAGRILSSDTDSPSLFEISPLPPAPPLEAFPYSLNNEVDSPTLARHTRYTRVLRTARGEEAIWNSGCCDYHPTRTRSWIHCWT